MHEMIKKIMQQCKIIRTVIKQNIYCGLREKKNLSEKRC